MGHNRDMSYYSKYPYVVRKCISVSRRISDLLHHTMIFPNGLAAVDYSRLPSRLGKAQASMALHSLFRQFFPRIMWNGIVSAVKGHLMKPASI